MLLISNVYFYTAIVVLTLSNKLQQGLISRVNKNHIFQKLNLCILISVLRSWVLRTISSVHVGISDVINGNTAVLCQLEFTEM